MWHHSPSARGGTARGSAAESRCRSGTDRVHQEMEVGDNYFFFHKTRTFVLFSPSLSFSLQGVYEDDFEPSTSEAVMGRRGLLSISEVCMYAPLTTTRIRLLRIYFLSFPFSGIFEHLGSKMLAGVRNFVIRTKVWSTCTKQCNKQV